MAKKVLAFDFGASSGRAMIGEYIDGQIKITEIHRFSNDLVKVGDRMYWDILRLFHEVKTAINLAVKAGPVDAIGIDTWGVDFGLLNKHGELLANPVNYRDERTVGMPEEVFEKIPKRELYALTGTQTMRINTLYQLYYLATRRPELLEQAETMLFIPDLIAYMLTGACRAEETIASTSNFFDPEKRTFCYELLEKLGIPTRILPEIIRPGESYGVLTPALCEEFDCDPIPVIAVCTHDTASAFASAPAEGDFACISCGTWSLFGTELQAPLRTEKSYEVEYTNEGGHTGTTRFLKNIIGLWLIQESRRQWIREGEQVSYADLEREALEAEPFQCFIDCDAPEFETSGDLPGRVRRFCEVTGQYVPQSRGEVMRCIYESLAMKYRMNIQTLSEVTGKKYACINMLGGGIKDTLLCRLTAAATGITVVAGPIEATVMGNVAVQLIALGEIENVKAAREVIKNSIEPMIYEPQDTAAWEAREAAYRKILGKSAQNRA
ncbi:MAG: rhamnulokinase [Clostridia bacterium]|nr:rhamnulokinase [Clostridia bacterium]